MSMSNLIGCGFVVIAFVIMRYIRPHLHLRNMFLLHLLHTTMTILDFGFLITGLALSFLSDVKIGFTLLGSFLWIYKNSFTPRRTGFRIADSSMASTHAALYGLPIFANRIAGAAGFILYVLGLTLIFISSVWHGLTALAAVFLAAQVVQLLNRVEWNYIEIQVSKDYGSDRE